MKLRPIAIPAALVTFALCLAACEGQDDGPGNNQGAAELQKGAPCTYAGGTFEDGRTFSSPDGCNSCTCTNGVALCTKRACPGLPPPIADGGPVGTPPADASAIEPDAEPPVDASVADAALPPVDAATSGCVYGGVTYPQGASFPSLDKCNSCFCAANGRVPCTKKLCIGDAGSP